MGLGCQTFMCQSCEVAAVTSLLIRRALHLNEEQVITHELPSACCTLHEQDGLHSLILSMLGCATCWPVVEMMALMCCLCPG